MSQSNSQQLFMLVQASSEVHPEKGPCAAITKTGIGEVLSEARRLQTLCREQGLVELRVATELEWLDFDGTSLTVDHQEMAVNEEGFWFIGRNEGPQVVYETTEIMRPYAIVCQAGRFPEGRLVPAESESFDYFLNDFAEEVEDAGRFRKDLRAAEAVMLINRNDPTAIVDPEVIQKAVDNNLSVERVIRS